MNDSVQPPSDEDRVWLARAEEYALNLLREAFGEVSLNRSVADLELVQALITKRRFRARQVLELQCLGVVLGNVFDAGTSMRWARVTNSFGDMLALHDQRVHFTLYPITMISKRFAQRREVDVPALYRTSVADLGLIRK
jgi:hypothetical protein